MHMNPANEMFDIIIAAGQSNAEGTGIGPVTEALIPTEMVCMLCDEAAPYYQEDAAGSHLVMNYPSAVHITPAAEPVIDGHQRGRFQFNFAQAYYDRYCKGTGRKVLVIEAAVGGTGFSRNEWGTQGAILYDRMVALTEYALSLNPENRIVAFLWHQGEHDTVENPAWDPEKRYSAHKQNLTKMLDTFCDTFHCHGIPMLTASFADEWYQKNKEPSDAVLNAIKAVFTGKNRTFIDASSLKSNNQQIGNGDDIHFSRESLHILGKLFFDAFVAMQ